jgi:hypothetical protein
MFGKLLFLILFVGLNSCSIDYKEANKRAVERFRLQIAEGKFEEIYNQSKENTKYYISKEEFLENMQLAVKTMKEFDESLVWEQDEAADEHRVHEASNYEETSWRKMRKDGRILDITIWWSNSFTFCDLIIREDAPDTPEIVVTRCSKS